MKFLWLLSIILVTVFLFSLIDARIFEKGQKRKKNGVEMSASKKSVETDAVKKEDEKTSISTDGNHDHKELRLVSVRTTAVQHNRWLRGEHKRRNHRRKSHKRGHHKRYHHKHSRNSKRNHKKGQQRNGKLRVCTHKPCHHKHDRHAQKPDKPAAGKPGTNVIKQKQNRKKGHQKRKEEKRKAELKKCTSEADCPRRGCCVRTRDGSGKVCRHPGHKACISKSSEHARKRKHSKGKKIKKGRLVESVDLSGKGNKFLEKSLRAIKMMRAKLKRHMRHFGDKRKMEGNKPQ